CRRVLLTSPESSELRSPPAIGSREDSMSASIRQTRCSNSAARFLPVLGLAAWLAAPHAARGQDFTYTKLSGGNFSNITDWNFTNGYTATNLIPFSNPTGTLIGQGWGTQNYTLSNDLNL